MKLYLAGPLFSTAERDFNTELKRLLEEAGHEVWLPQEHEPRHLDAEALFRKDVEGIDWADVLVANMDGPDPDSGTCWECGYAYKKKKIIAFRTDFRAADDPAMGPYNLMLTQSSDVHLELPLKSVTEIAESITKALTKLG